MNVKDTNKDNRIPLNTHEDYNSDYEFNLEGTHFAPYNHI